MNAELLDKLRCPAPGCRGVLTLTPHASEKIEYAGGPVEEVREGSLNCVSCGRSYPIEGYVPSFEELFTARLREEAEYWSLWYGAFWELGYRSFFDARLPRPPLLLEGIEIADPPSLGGRDLVGSLEGLVAHLTPGEETWLVDIGCGTGWSSLYLGRAGYRVVAFDPSAANIRLAKRYAIEQGVYIEYIAGALGYIEFAPETFDAALALHALHHVPDTGKEVERVREWLRGGGLFAVDEHIRDNPTLSALWERADTWARSEIFPRLRTPGNEIQAKLPQSSASAMEGAGSEEVVSAVVNSFRVERVESRYVSLNSFPFYYFLARGEDETGYHYAAEIISYFYRFWGEVFPLGAEYVTLVTRKRPGNKAGDGDGVLDSEQEEQSRALAQRALLIAGYDASGQKGSDPALAALKSEHAFLLRQLTQVNLDLEATRQRLSEALKQLDGLEGWALGLERQAQGLESWARSMQTTLLARPGPLARLRRIVSKIRPRR